MSALQLNLGYGDSIIFAATLFGFLGKEGGQNVWHLNDMLEHYGRSSEIIQESWSDGAVRDTCWLCDVFELVLEATPKKDGTQLTMKLRDTRELNPKMRMEWTHVSEPIRWGRKYACPDLGRLTFASDQVMSVMHELSQMKHQYDEWKYFSDL